MTYLINQSFAKGVVPNQLKLAKVIPIHKSSDKSQLKNYRPVSLLPALSKIFEKIMFNKVMGFLNSNNSLYKHKYGFRAKHSTIHPILHLINQCADADQKTPKEHTISIFCDLSKAFDVIDHKILLQKMHFYGFRGIVYNWFENYLTGRRQYVEIEESRSNIYQIECGVPQGSILGPLLCLIYVNDIAMSTTANILSFADDTSLYLSNSDERELYVSTNSAIKSLYEWFCANKLALNASKTKYIILRAPHTRCQDANLDIHIGNTALEKIGSHSHEQSTKFLRLVIDEHLTWKNHLAHVNKKISGALFSIKQAKNILPKASLRTLYFALIEPHLSYGILAWGNANKKTLHKTEMLQKRAIRTINNAKYRSHTDPLFRKSQVLKLSDMYTLQATLFMYDYTNNRLPSSFSHIFPLNREIQESRLTRQSHLFYITRGVSNFSGSLPKYNLPRIWNEWTPKIPEYTSRTHFKNNIHKSFIASYLESVKCSNNYCRDCFPVRPDHIG